MAQGPILVIILLAAIIFIVLATSKFKLHPFLSLILAAYGLGFAAGIPAIDITKDGKTIQGIGTLISAGFGNTLTSIGIVIIAGTIIGTILEKSGAAIKMAEVILKVVGEKRPAMAMSIIGYIVSIPVFCDSGFVILSSLNKSLAKRSKASLVAMSVALSTGLYATHTLVPPTPGPIAAAANLKLDNLLLVIAIGMLCALPAVITGYVFATRYSSKFASVVLDDNVDYDKEIAKYGKLPSGWMAFAPIAVPIIALTLGSIAGFPGKPFGDAGLAMFFKFIGTPVNALIIGVLFAFLLLPKFDEETLSGWVGQGLKDAAIIIMITGAGGSLGNVIRATPIGTYIGESLKTMNVGIFLPFIIAAALKTAQGSSTVSLVTTSAIVFPLLGPLGFATDVGKALIVMAIGAGAMTVSHANDSYFWVVSQFGGMDVKTAYKNQTVATLLQGIATIIFIAILSFIFKTMGLY